MKRNFKIVIEYDGTLYKGWQKQKSAKTIQEEIEKALKIITCKDVTIAGTGRTDAGVHSYGQTASFFSDTKLECKALQKGLNAILPKQIVIVECSIEKYDFHARYSAKSKVYHYRVLNSPIRRAINRDYFLHITKRLDIVRMKAALNFILGTYDFSAFEGSGSPKKSSVRTILNAKIYEEGGGYIIFELEGDGFLRYMARNIVGTLIEVGTGKRTPEEFKKILKSKDRSLAGKTVSAKGLFLMKVFY
ncbi:MAG: tRNA pseudouridine(38-40) synthase TruA [Deltaproteobacteria bacterium]|nr:tRNA pseudouridine(38-40) synthase TruA [Deltaproteobacteria bacterium]